jgi:succinate dehydrogenase / fumarate reductase cytochrome b subunit
LNWLTRTINSTIGQKVIVGLTGLALVLFMITHVGGNLLMYAGDDGASFNAYSDGLHSLGLLLYVAEAGLLAMLIVHVVFVIRLSRRNAQAGGAGRYAVSASKTDGGAKNKSSKMMLISGSIVLAFLFVHIWDFRLQYPPPEGQTLFDMVVAALQEPWRVGLYVVGSLLISWHVLHGFQSAFRSLGLNHPTWTPLLSRLGLVLALVFGIGFASFPIWIFLTQ